LRNRSGDRIDQIDPDPGDGRCETVDGEEVAHCIVIVYSGDASAITHTRETALVVVEILGLVGRGETCDRESKTYLNENPEDSYIGG
jgi:hypothetical protein